MESLFSPKTRRSHRRAGGGCWLSLPGLLLLAAALVALSARRIRGLEVSYGAE